VTKARLKINLKTNFLNRENLDTKSI